jgi:hypothetical protein
MSHFEQTQKSPRVKVTNKVLGATMKQADDFDTQIAEHRKRLVAALEDLVILQGRKRGFTDSDIANELIAAQNNIREIGIRVAEYESLNIRPQSSPAWQLSSLRQPT